MSCLRSKIINYLGFPTFLQSVSHFSFSQALRRAKINNIYKGPKYKLHFKHTFSSTGGCMLMLAAGFVRFLPSHASRALHTWHASRCTV
jgi:hypothetical protein